MPQQMGLGELGNPKMIFVRKFRFTLRGKYLMAEFNKTVEIDYFAKKIYVSIMEVYESDNKTGKTHAHAWAERLESGEWADEELKFTTFDGCGNELYAKVFKGLKLAGKGHRFDYSSSEEAVLEVALTYESCEDAPLTEDTHPTEPRETKIDYLNARMFIK